MLRTLITTTAAVAAILASAPAANAGPLEVGSNPPGNYPITATSVGASMSFPGTTISCTFAAATGVVHAAASVPAPYLELTSSAFLGCTPSPLKINQVCDLEISLDAGNTFTNSLTDTVDSLVSSDCIRIGDDYGGILCSFDIYGTTPNFSASFDEGSQQLSINVSGIYTSSVSGCFGWISNGDPMSYNMTFAINTGSSGPINFKP